MAKESQGVVCFLATASAQATSVAANQVAEVVGFSGPSESGAVIDVTDLTATAKTKLVGVYDGGQVTLNMNFNVTATSHMKIREMLSARTLGNLMIQLSSATTTQKIAMKGYVTGFNVTGSVDNKIASDMTFSISGGVTFTT